MIKTDESALICDLAEIYHIYDYRSLPATLVATFSVGLRENSRIKMALANIKYPLDTLLMAAILDGINLGNWMRIKSAGKGTSQPKSIVDRLLGRDQEEESERIVFDTAEEFERERKRLLEGRE